MMALTSFRFAENIHLTMHYVDTVDETSTIQCLQFTVYALSAHKLLDTELVSDYFKLHYRYELSIVELCEFFIE